MTGGNACSFAARLFPVPDVGTPNERQGGTWDAFFWVSDVQSLHDEMHANGADIVQDPILQTEYGMKEFAARDPNGYVLGFGQEWKS